MTATVAPVTLPNRVLYAAVRADEAVLARAAGRGLTVVVGGAAAAVIGRRPRAGADIVELAVAHDRVMQQLLTRCSAVLPFRFGMAAPAATDLRRMLRDNAGPLAGQLDRFHERVEMGLKIKTRRPGRSAADFDVGPVHALVTRPHDRIEGVVALPDALLFEGVYLVARAGIDDFWAALERIRNAAPSQAIVGVGPFAAYSFCDLQIEPPGFIQTSK